MRLQMRNSINEFYKRYHGIDNIPPGHLQNLLCMEKLVEIVMRVSIEKIESIHGEIRYDKAYLAVEHYLENGLKEK